MKTAERHGFRNILSPSTYQAGQDRLSFVAGCAPITEGINLLAAVRCGEKQRILLATLDHTLEGRLTVNIISSDFPGQTEDSGYRYHRSREVVEMLKQAWSRDEINHAGEVYNFSGLTTDPVKSYQTDGPLRYFSGYLPDALDLCAEHCDVYLISSEPKEALAGRMQAVRARGGKRAHAGLRPAGAHDRARHQG